MSTRAQSEWVSSVMPAVVVPAVVGAELAADARARLEAAKYTRYLRIDRGSYDFVEAPPVPELVEALGGVAEAVTGRAVKTVESVRALRLSPGDYLLNRHDRVYDDRRIELVLDLSAEAIDGAEVHWRHRGQVFFAMKSEPGALAIVERGPTVMQNHLYVSKRGTVPVVRLTVFLLLSGG